MFDYFRDAPLFFWRGGDENFFKTNNFFSVLLSVQTNFFRLHLSADNFFFVHVVQPVVSVGDDDDDDDNNNNKLSMFLFFLFFLLQGSQVTVCALFSKFSF